MVVSRTTSGSEPIEQLVIIVRPNDYLTRSVGQGASLERFIPTRPMAGDLSFFLAVDSPEAIRTVSIDDLKRWGVGEAAAWTRATRNVKARVGPLSPIRLGDEDGAVGFGAESSLAPSVLADPSFCGPASPNGIAGQVVLVFARDEFLYPPPGNRLLTDRFWRAVKQETAAGRSLSSTPLTCKGGKWVLATR